VSERQSKLPLSVQAVAQWEKLVSEQRNLIADLKTKGESIVRAESNLNRYQAFLKQLCIHREIIQGLMTPAPHQQSKAKRTIVP
jgi:hypothetical protein